MEPQIVLITGATSGIGEACANLYAKNGYNLIITGRREEKLNQLKLNLENNFSVKVLTLCFDVRNADDVAINLNSIPLEFKKVDILINNAGLSQGLDPIQTGDIGDWDRMIDTNVKGLLYVTRNVVPMMEGSKQAHIINLGSIAGKEVYPNGNVYCATKHAVDALNKAMRIDLLPKGIKVTAINPGMVETEFSEVRFHGECRACHALFSRLAGVGSRASGVRPADRGDAAWLERGGDSGQPTGERAGAGGTIRTGRPDPIRTSAGSGAW